MRTAARAIVIKDGKLLVTHRNKFGKEYDTLPGGNVEMGETPEQAAIRETMEETSIQVKNPRLVIIEHAGVPYGDQVIYVFEYVQGEPKLQEGSEEEMIQRLGQNLYQPMWVALDELPSRPFLSEQLKQTILDNYRQWPEHPIELG